MKVCFDNSSSTASGEFMARLWACFVWCELSSKNDLFESFFVEEFLDLRYDLLAKLSQCKVQQNQAL